MSESRKKIVDAAFNKMDKDNAGFITMDILKYEKLTHHYKNL